jgi:hypothetical protein
MNLRLLLFGVYNINNFQTILVNSLLFHSNSFCVSNLCAKLYRKPLKNHKKTKQHSSFFFKRVYPRVCSCPLLFLVYINDIDDKLLSLSRLFADDTSLGYASQDKVINHDLHELGDLSFNPNKTEIMLFKNVENSTNFDFNFDGKLIPLTHHDSHQVHVDHDL